MSLKSRPSEKNLAEKYPFVESFNSDLENRINEATDKIQEILLKSEFFNRIETLYKELRDTFCESCLDEGHDYDQASENNRYNSLEAHIYNLRENHGNLDAVILGQFEQIMDCFYQLSLKEISELSRVLDNFKIYTLGDISLLGTLKQADKNGNMFKDSEYESFLKAFDSAFSKIFS